MPDPTINTSMLSISTGNGPALSNGGSDSTAAARKPANPNRLYISGLPYNWRTQHVSARGGGCVLWGCARVCGVVRAAA
jgi:hypothetical protein